jgi:HSP20 family protein
MKTLETKQPGGLRWGAWPRALLAFPGLDEWFDDDFRVEEYTEDGVVVVRAELAGLDPEKDVDITMTGDSLTIHAERRREEKTDERNYHREEMRYGAFTRTLPLPVGATADDVTATYKDGVLEVRVPVKERAAPTKVAVERS